MKNKCPQCSQSLTPNGLCLKHWIELAEIIFKLNKN